MGSLNCRSRTVFAFFLLMFSVFFSVAVGAQSSKKHWLDEEEVLILGTPTVTLTEPLANTLFAAPADITLRAQASVRVSGIRQVDFLNGSSLIGSSVTAPYAFVWQRVPAGIYQLSARATSGLSFSGQSQPVEIKVCDVPSATLALSAAAIDLTQSVHLTAQATSPANACRVIRVELYAKKGDAIPALLTTFTGLPPYEADWTPDAAGTYTLTAKAYDERNITATSTATSLVVRGSVTPPTIVLNQPLNSARYTANSTIPLAATVDVPGGSVQQIAFLNGASTIATGTLNAGQYTAGWSNVPAGEYTLTARLTDNTSATHDSNIANIKVCAPPTIQLAAPGNAIAPASVTLSATASAASGCATLSKVIFYQNGTLIGESTTAPYQYNWQNIAAGTYTLTAKAIDDLGGETLSAGVPFTVTVPGPEPTITLTAPTTNGSYYAGGNTGLIATTDAANVSKVEFFSGANKIGTGTLTGGEYRAAWTNMMPPGPHQVFARLTTTANATYDSLVVTINVLCTADVQITSPAEGATAVAPGHFTLTAQTSAVEGCGDIEKVEFYRRGQLLHTATTAPYTFSWTGVPAGDYELYAIAYLRDSGRSTQSPSVNVTVEEGEPPPEIAITAPNNGAMINGDTIDVHGTLTYRPGAIVILNGRQAQINENGSFVIYDVPLLPGENSLTAVLNTNENNPVEASITVTRVDAASFNISMSPATGLAPLETRLTVLPQEGDSFANYCLGLSYRKNDGPSQDIAAIEKADQRIFVEDEILFVFNLEEPGQYQFYIDFLERDIENDTCGSIIQSASRTIVAEEPAKLGKNIAGVYFAMLKQLSLNQPSKALKYFTGEAQARYESIFADLDGELPTIAEQLSTVVNGVMNEGVMELMVTTDTDEGKKVFPVYLLRGPDGIWRIDGM